MKPSIHSKLTLYKKNNDKFMISIDHSYQLLLINFQQKSIKYSFNLKNLKNLNN